jgi:hypothetical protein
VTSPSGVGVIESGTYRPVALPLHGQAIAADGTTAVAVVGDAFVRQTAGRPTARPRALPRPRGAGAKPIRVEAVGADLLLVVWPAASGTGQLAALVETAGGTLVAQTALDVKTDLTHVGVVRETGGLQTLVGSVLVDTYTNSIDLLDERYTVFTVTRGHAWAKLDGHATDIHLNKNAELRPQPFATGEPVLPIGVVAAAGMRPETAVVVAPSDGGWVLAGLPVAAAKES